MDPNARQFLIMFMEKYLTILGEKTNDYYVLHYLALTTLHYSSLAPLLLEIDDSFSSLVILFKLVSTSVGTNGTFNEMKGK